MFAVYLAVSAAPVSAAHIAVVSSNSTATELGSATLTNAEVIDSLDSVDHDVSRPSAVARWNFDAGSGSTAIDDVGNRHLTLSGASWTSNGVALDPGDDLVSSDVVSTPTTVSMVINPNPSSSSTQQLVGNGFDYAGDSGWQLKIDSNRELSVFYGNTLVLVTDPVINPNARNQVGLTIESDGTVRVYHNGTLVKSGGGTLEPANTNQGLVVGGNDFHGEVVDLAMHSSPLSPGLQTRHERHPVTKFTAPATDRWAFDRGSGEIKSDEGKTSTVGFGEFDDGVVGSAINFDPTLDGNSTSLGDYGSAQTYSVSFYLRPDAVDTSSENDYRRILSTSGLENFVVLEEGQTLSHRVPGVAESTFKAGSVPIDAWSFVTMRYNGSHRSIWVNGSLAASDPVTSGTANLDGVELAPPGAANRNNDLNASVDELRFYHRALSADEIARLSTQPASEIPQTSTYSTSHSVTNSVSGFTDLTLKNATATVTWRTGSGAVLNQSTFSTSGNHTLTWSESSADNVDIDVEFSPTGPHHIARLNAEGVRSNTSSPSVIGLSPNTTSTTVDQVPVPLSLTVDDSDFSTAQGDTVTVEWSVDGSEIASQTISSSQEVTAYAGGLQAGTHDWSVRLVDEFGNEVTSDTASFAIPSGVTIRNVSTGEKINDTVDIKAKLYSGELIFEKTTNDGTIDLTGINADRGYIIEVSADGYVTRTIAIKSVFDQSSLYLLPENTSTVYQELTLNDLTGEFEGSNTVLYVERPIETNGTIEWQVVSGDYFGSDQIYKTELEKDQRYRLVIENDDGDRRELGAYVPTKNSSATLEVGQIRWQAPKGETYQWHAYIDERNSSLVVAFDDSEKQTTSLKIIVHERGDDSEILFESSATNLSTFKRTQPLSQSQLEQDWAVDITLERNNQTITIKEPISSAASIRTPVPIDSRWATLAGLVLLVALSAAFPSTLSRVGAVAVVSVATGITWLGWVDIPMSVIGLSGAVALLGLAASFNSY
ncbi:hypothetical protein DEQ92_10370 [Haloferax sp. Atlit-6N]|nr:hypothetical protein DEQ92_10195 [Haloferax sp. Atlit-6N]REA03520.1 hypothetical protein DEQ92_10370 [Haloferax sp. Atlit-6N]